ncbi:hypothetical protein [Geovibrio sp. ADMFC3]
MKHLADLHLNLEKGAALPPVSLGVLTAHKDSGKIVIRIPADLVEMLKETDSLKLSGNCLESVGGFGCVYIAMDAEQKTKREKNESDVEGFFVWNEPDREKGFFPLAETDGGVSIFPLCGLPRDDEPMLNHVRRQARAFDPADFEAAVNWMVSIYFFVQESFRAEPVSIEKEYTEALQRKYTNPKKRAVAHANAFNRVYLQGWKSTSEKREAFRTGRALQGAWIVRGHWRQQAHGSGHKERRLTWIAPHWKGSGVVTGKEYVLPKPK